MATKFNPTDGFDKIPKKAREIAKGATDTLGSAGAVVGETVGNAAKTVSETASSVASSVEENLSSAGEKVASSEAGRAISNAISVAGSAAGGFVGVAAHTAQDAVAGIAQTAQNTAESIVHTVKENSPSARRKRARISGFKDGINQGAYLASEARYNFYYAYVATLCYFLRTDGEYSTEEQEWLSQNLNHLRLEGGLPEEVKCRLMAIAENDTITFDDVKAYLDKVSIRSLDSIADSVHLAINLDDEVSREEQCAEMEFKKYMISQMEASCSSQNSYGEKRIQESINEYSGEIDRIKKEFADCTKLQGFDLAFLAVATFLQVARVLIINAVTQIETAGQGNQKEKALHDLQNKLLKNFDETSNQSSFLYASTQHIISARGVPYDATAGGRGLFKGANHRFSTLGHDPLLGMIFGTSNIITNTITCIEKTDFGLNIPLTYAVEYDHEGKNPFINVMRPAGTLQMLSKAGDRVLHDPSAAAAALIKQILHVGTDLYTPCGIQLPFANIALDKTHVETLTKCVSMGDLLKVGAQASVAVFINWLVAALHGCSLIFKNENDKFSEDLYSVRTKKIILLSNTIATSSSVIQAAITKNPKCFDLGGSITLAYRLLTDAKFYALLQEDYLNSGLNDIYEQRAKGILY